MTTDTSGRMWVTTHDLQIGLAIRDCPYCLTPVRIHLPSMHDAIADKGSDALRLGLDELTVTERRLFDCIYAYFPQGVSNQAVSQVMGDMWPPTVKQNVYRLRKKLGVRGWLLVSLHGSLRLVKPEP